MDMDPNTTFTTSGQVALNTTDVDVNKTCSFETQLYIFDPRVQAVFIGLYVIIFVVGVGGNLAVLAVVLGNKHMRTPINLYLVNLAAADLIICFTGPLLTPMSTYGFIWDHWAYGPALCRLLPSCMHVTVYMSTFTLTAIAVDRYWAVFYPFNAKNNSLTRTVLIAIFIDLLAIIFTTPYTWSLHLVPDLIDVGKSYCSTYTRWPSGLKLMYPLFINITQFFIPFVTIVICYTKIMTHLRQRAIGGRSESMTTHQMLEETTRIIRMNKMLISIAVIFGICWFPINLINLGLNIFSELGENLHCWKLLYLFFILTHVIAMSSTCYNPFFYGWLNPAFRAEFAKFGFCATKGRLQTRM